MCCAHTNLFTGFDDAQIRRDRHLIALHTPHFQNSRVIIDQFEFGFLVEQSTTVGSIVFDDIQTWWIRFWEENTFVILSGQYCLQKFEMIHFLRATFINEQKQNGLRDLQTGKDVVFVIFFF